MSKSVWVHTAAIVLLAACAILLPAPGQRVAAQSPGMFVNAVDLDIVPAERDKFLAALTENGKAAVTEPGRRRFDILNLNSDPNHFLLYEVYDNEAAFQAHAPPTISRSMRPQPAPWSPSATRGRCR
jgi:quinol monooxygenase YgiN